MPRIPSLIPLLLLTALALLGTALSACKTGSRKDQPNTTAPANTRTDNMTLTPLPTPPPGGDYAEEWHIIDSLATQGLFQSALEKTNALEARARTDARPAQVVKALIHKAKYTTLLEEDGIVKAIEMLEQHTATAAQPERAVLHSYMAELYEAYLMNQGWRIRNRTEAQSADTPDAAPDSANGIAPVAAGWLLAASASQIERRILQLYAASVEMLTPVLSTPADVYRDILTPDYADTVQGYPLRAHLYDVLASRAIAHFSNDRSYLTEPAYAFLLQQPEAFAPVADFVKYPFGSRDNWSGKRLAIKTFQKLLAQYLPGGSAADNTAALIAADLERLQFVRNSSTLPDKETRYLQALEALHQQHTGQLMDAEILWQMAEALHTPAEQISDEAQDANDHRAVALLEEAIRRYPDSYGAKMSQVRLQDIRHTTLVVDVEKVNLPNRPALISLLGANLKTVHVRVVRISGDPADWEKIRRDNERNGGITDEQWLKHQTPVQKRSWALVAPDHYRPSRTEIYLDPLPIGNYWLLVSGNEDFDQAQQHEEAFVAFSVSNLAVVSYAQGDRNVCIVMHRASGAALSGVKFDFFKGEYQNGQASQRLIGSTVSDANGFAQAMTLPNAGVEGRASLDGDTLWIGAVGHYYRQHDYQPRPQMQFFTDRSIYRPGQTVYFKGVAFQQLGAGSRKVPQILPNQKATLRFYDANNQPKASLELRTNEFGTVHGAFTAPTGGLTGDMSIRCDQFEGWANFSVEEYKRPKFEVTIQPVQQAFRVNDKITVRGEAKNYAGSAVGEAQVRYRVTRMARYPMWDWGWYRKVPEYAVSEQEIVSGLVQTNESGQFAIDFQALPDHKVPKKAQPVFDYAVSVDVTDITGETRSTSATVSVAYSALQMSWGLENNMDLDSLKHVTLKATNLADQPLPASGEITLQRLVAPKTPYLNRYWDAPNVATLQKADFKRLFPDYAYMNEDDPAKWDREDYLISIPFSTTGSGTVSLQNGRVQPGYYWVKLSTKDAYGEPLTLERAVHVYDSGQPLTRFALPDHFVEKSPLEPGQTARIWWGTTAAPLLHVLYLRADPDQPQTPRWLSVRGTERIEIPIQEADRGGIALQSVAVLNNRIYGPADIRLEVPWTNKDLTVRYETFRDKLAPGQAEEWRIRISGPKKDRVAAEMVAAMYDASLDQFRSHDWRRIDFPSMPYFQPLSDAGSFQSEQGYSMTINDQSAEAPRDRQYPLFNWFDFPFWGGPRRYMKAAMTMARSNAPQEEMLMAADMAVVKEEAGRGMDIKFDNAVPPPPAPAPAPAPPASIRRNLNETVFFFPELRTDAQGDVVLKFSMNEALTRWKLLTYTHTKDLQQAISVKEVVTQKELMVLVNMPRFLRAGDEFEFSAKVSNLSQQAINGGTATLNLLDANTLQPVEAAFGLGSRSPRIATFSVAPGQSAPLTWQVKIPEDYTGALTWQIFAEGQKFRDGEESTLPVVTNRTLVTETLPISLRGNQTKTVVFDNLKNAPTGSGSSLSTQCYTLEFSSNPVWYAVQALPYLMEYPYECSEQMFSRFYANTLASTVVEKMPNIKRVYERWKANPATGKSDPLASNLSKNQELKSALLEETPWVLDAQSEEQQKQQIALLFDLNRMANERERALSTLAQRQNDDGSWAWFPDGPGNWYITQHIASGFGHLIRLGALDVQQDARTADMLDRALGYCEGKANERYREIEKLVQSGKTKWDDDHLDDLLTQYLYARSLQAGPNAGDKPGREISYFLDQAEKHWLKRGLYEQGLLSLALHRSGRQQAARQIVASLRERATQQEELGMYWPVDWGYYWYQLPVETQALMVEVFSEVANDPKAVEELRIWLLKNKQTNRWESTKATAEAVYALLIGTDFRRGELTWLSNTAPVQVSMGGKTLKVSEYEPGTGYFKEQWPGREVKPSWSEIKVQNPNSNIAWGAAYWQYFEDLDKVKDFRKTPLSIVKQLFLEENSPSGPVLRPVGEGQHLKRGDRLKVRVEIRTDRAMEFVHLKDMRAAGFEPINVLSQYKWQDGLGYYESTRDLATHFFIDYLPRGTYIFEYPLVVSHRGDMSNGITTMQCMYAPEFSSHSQGVRVRVE